jgi:hypothetical protein
VPPQVPIRVLRHLIQPRPLLPGRLTQPVLSGLMIRLGNNLFQPFPSLALRLEQPAAVMFHGGCYRARPTAAMATAALTKANDPLPNSRQQPHFGVGSRGFLTPSGAVPSLFHLAVPCILIKRVLSLLTHKNQSNKSDKVELAIRFHYSPRLQGRVPMHKGRSSCRRRDPIHYRPPLGSTGCWRYPIETV